MWAHMSDMRGEGEIKPGAMSLPSPQLCSVTLEGLKMADMNQLGKRGIKAETLISIQLSLYYGEKCIRGNQLTTPKKLGPVGSVIWNERLWIAPNIKIKDLPKVCIHMCARTVQAEEL